MRTRRSFLCVIGILTALVACGGGGDESAPSKEPSEALLPSFELRAPIHNSKDVSVTPTLRWTDLEGEAGYDIEIDETQEFPDPVKFSVSSDVNEFLIPPGILQPKKEYYWRVSALGIVASNGPFAFQTHPWAKRYSLPENQFVTSLEPTRDGGFIAAGYTTPSNPWSPDAIVSRFAGDGSIVWQKRYGTSGPDVVNGIRKTSDGGYILVGRSQSALWMAKLDAEGMVSWSRREGSIEEASSVAETSDGKFAVVGHIYASGAVVLLVKPDGTVEWGRTYGIPGLDHSKLSCVQALQGGGWIAAGSKHVAKKQVGAVTSNEWDLWLLKFTPTGVMEWEASYGYRAKDAGTNEGAYSIVSTADGFAVSGYLGTNDRNWILQIGPEGTLKWHRSYVQENGGYLTQNRSIELAPDGDLLVAGKTPAQGFDGCLLTLNPDGSIDSERRYGGSGYEAFSLIEKTATGEYVLAGTMKMGDDFDLWIVKSYMDGYVPPIGPTIIPSGNELRESTPYEDEPVSISDKSEVGKVSLTPDAWVVAVGEISSAVVPQAP